MAASPCAAGDTSRTERDRQSQTERAHRQRERDKQSETERDTRAAGGTALPPLLGVAALNTRERPTQRHARLERQTERDTESDTGTAGKTKGTHSEAGRPRRRRLRETQTASEKERQRQTQRQREKDGQRSAAQPEPTLVHVMQLQAPECEKVLSLPLSL